MIYFIIFLLLLGLSYFYDYKGQRRGYEISFYLVLVVFILFAGLRYKVGGDTGTYMKFFDRLPPLSSIKAVDFASTRFAPGFVVFTSTIKNFTGDVVWFQLIHSLIVNSVIFFFLRRNCKHLFFALFLFFNYLYLYLLFEQVRESLAVAIFLLFWPAFKKKIWWQWYIGAFLAFMMHVSAFILFLLPLIYLPGIRKVFTFGKRTLWICLGVFIMAIVIQKTLFRYVEMISVTETMMDRVQAYGEMERSGGFNLNHIIGSIIQFIAYPLIALFYLNKKRTIRNIENDTSEPEPKEDMMALMSVYISIFSIFVGILIRYNNYFFIFAIILMSNWAFTQVNNVKSGIRIGYLYWVFIFLPMLGFNFYSTYYASVNRNGTLKAYMMYYPYYSVLDPQEDHNRQRTIVYVRRSLES